jgi:hemolysin activation/secretion protein
MGSMMASIGGRRAAAWSALLLGLGCGTASAQPGWGTGAEVVGNTLYATPALLDYAATFVEAEHGAVTPPALAAAIERLYREDGYFLAAVRPSVDPATGRPRLDIQEGVVTRLEVRGVPERLGARIASYVRPLLAGSPLRLEAVERAVMLAGDLAGVQLRTEFVADGPDGAPAMVIHATARPRRFYAIADTTPRTQAANGYLTGEFYSLLAPGDMTRVTLGASTRTDGDASGLSIAAFHRSPVGDAGTYVEVFASNTLHGRDLSGGLADSRQQSGTNLIALVGHPVLRNAQEHLYALAEIDAAEIDFGQAGVEKERSHAVRLSAVYSHADHSYGSFRALATLSFGTTDNSWNPNVDRGFWHLRAAAGLLLPVGPPEGGYALRLQAHAQLSADTLPETERFYLGDRDRLRGYAVGTLTGDSGVVATLDASRFISLGEGWVRAVVPGLFLDVGTVRRNRDFHVMPVRQATAPVGDSARNLASAGVAGRAYLANDLILSGWLGMPLVEDGRQRLGPAAYLRLTTFW